MRRTHIPQFFLYGEPPAPVGERFVHLEELGERGRPAAWSIQPHVHKRMSQVFLISRGSGTMSADEMQSIFSSPCILIVPSNVVHAFESDIRSRGHALTISDSYRDELIRREPGLSMLFESPRILGQSDLAPIEVSLRRLAEELNTDAAGQALYVEGLLAGILVEILRLAQASHQARSQMSRDRDAALVSQFKAIVEDAYRRETRVEAYAKALNIPPKRLRAACSSQLGMSPRMLIGNRIMLEARRALLYTDMTVAETAYYLGFDDPAYFSRAFTKACGASPTEFRNIGPRCVLPGNQSVALTCNARS